MVMALLVDSSVSRLCRDYEVRANLIFINNIPRIVHYLVEFKLSHLLGNAVDVCLFAAAFTWKLYNVA